MFQFSRKKMGFRKRTNWSKNLQFCQPNVLSQSRKIRTLNIGVWKRSKKGWLRVSNQLPVGYLTSVLPRICFMQATSASATQNLHIVGFQEKKRLQWVFFINFFCRKIMKILHVTWKFRKKSFHVELKFCKNFTPRCLNLLRFSWIILAAYAHAIGRTCIQGRLSSWKGNMFRRRFFNCLNWVGKNLPELEKVSAF